MEISSLFTKEEGFYLILCAAIEHCVKFLKGCQMSIIRSFGKNKWFTTDDPVVIDRHNVWNYILPIETEIYLSLSKEYCVYLYDPDSPINNLIMEPARKNPFVESNEAMYQFINDKICSNMHKHIIYPMDDIDLLNQNSNS